jgi:hypothetical protein
MGADNQFAGLVKKMLFKFKTSIESKQIPKDITKIEQEKNIIARDAQLELLNVIIDGINRIESSY